MIPKSCDFSDKIMRPNNSMIPKRCRLFGPDHATEQQHDPEKLYDFSDKIMRPNKLMPLKSLRDFSGESMRLKNATAKSQRHGRRPAPLPLRMTSGGGARPFADMRGLG